MCKNETFGALSAQTMYCLKVREMGVLVVGKALGRLYRIYRSVEKAKAKALAKVRSKGNARWYHPALDSRGRRRSDGVRAKSLLRVSVGVDRGRGTARAPVLYIPCSVSGLQLYLRWCWSRQRAWQWRDEAGSTLSDGLRQHHSFCIERAGRESRAEFVRGG